MKILVYPHDLGVGGSQLNAIEIAHEISRQGHETLVYGQPGPLCARIDELGLEFVESPPVHRRPTRSVVQDIGRLIDQRGIDIVHGYEWPPGLESYLACRGRAAAPVATVMSMAVAPFLPHSMPLVVGTEQIAASERGRRRQLVSVIEPPVDLVGNRPGVAGDAHATREQWNLRGELPIIVCVTRLARELKLEGLLTAIAAIAVLDRSCPAQLLIVGDGPARKEVEDSARRVNEAIGRRAVVLTGEVADPRSAYDLADVCIAMGGSALRSMAFAKPLIVQGEGGFFRLLTPDTLPEFLWTGWYGHGSLTGNPVEELRALLDRLLLDPVRRLELGLFARQVVEDRFSLTAAATTQLEVYDGAQHQSRRTGHEEIVATARFARHDLVRRTRRWLGRTAEDDFNARPVARDALPRPSTS
ncbi:glycosyltransferase [Aeromicrobium wangtongii]|uniref:Glycosyltransferase n=1 Tax=Aeromicrobium wangtongii TaxID=2969247 RepID=A0ABY5MBQ2_9ACTN|nr:glycosyltransferase [Aeromicrobium wangtongii]MCD9196889.1 glycosyltransferase [Aeromicrobium wangtongii]UUP14395.1 glycosyltransferase [Aeromicrobium wangtongii]